MIIDDKLMNYVLYKMRTESEVRQKCKILKLDEEYVEEAVEYLKEANYINDEIYAKKYIENIMRLKHCSQNEIKIDLLKRGIDQNTIENYLYTEETLEFEEESAKYLINKKISLGEEPLKIKKYMINKGYDFSLIEKYLFSD